jgi:hexosaminidase
MFAFLLAAVAAPAWVPWPKGVTMGEGTLTLPARTVIETAQPELRPLAKVLADEVRTVQGAEWRTGDKGQVILRIDKGLRPEVYRLQIADRVRVTGGSYQAVAMGTATLLQSLGTGLSVPRVDIRDEPAYGYRGMLVDVARKYHSPAVLRQCIEMCRLYKIRFLQLHLTDDQLFTFPSRAYPKLATPNAYTRQELADLVRFAHERGVTLVPEFDIPGHTGAMIQAMPELFKIAGTKPYEHHGTINFANEGAIRAVETIIDEMCDVFRSSPYFHMGGDEADISNADQHPDFQAAFAKEGLTGKAQHEIFRRFIRRINEKVKTRGKRLIVWEGFGREPQTKFPIPKDVLIMEFESAYYLPTDLQADGYEMVNAAWTPLYVVNRHVWPARKVYEWSPNRFGRHSTVYPTTTWFETSNRGILGAQVCAWEQPEHLVVTNFRRIAPAMAERIWNPAAGRSYEDFATRFESTDRILERLIQPVKIDTSALNPKGPDDFDVPTFTAPLTIRLGALGKEIRYTLDGTVPTSDSPRYERPFTVTDTTTVRAVIVEGGKRSEYESAQTFYYAPPKTPNLATGKRVTVSGRTEGAQTPELAVDDNLSLNSSWWATPGPQWLQVDLGEEKSVGRIEVFPYWDGARYYQYTVEVSLDGKEWTQVADRSKNTLPANASGDAITFPGRAARYVRVNMLKGSANPGVHLVELKVWPPKA